MRACEMCGVAISSLHAFRELKRAIPTATIIGNGDIAQYSDFARMLETTKCDAVMVGCVHTELIFSH